MAVHYCLVDSHAHLQLDPLFGQIGLALSNAVTAGVNVIVVNAVCPGEDWDRVEKLCSGYLEQQSPLLIPSFGLHPWWIEKMLTDLPSGDDKGIKALCSNVRHQLTQKLLVFPMAGVGECGLDKVIKKNVSLDTQESLLRCHLEVAMEYDRPASLHCVGAWGRLFEVLLTFDEIYEHKMCLKGQEKIGYDIKQSAEGVGRKLKFVVVLHSCNKMPIDMYSRFQQLRRIPLYYSFNGKQLDVQVSKLLLVIPRDKLLIETDSPDQMPTAVPTTSTNTRATDTKSTDTTNNSTVTVSPSLAADTATTANTTTLLYPTPINTVMSTPSPSAPFTFDTSIAPLREVCNQPANIALTCSCVSALLGECSIEIANVTARNAMLVFTGSATS